jgi:hypothetical protein
MIIHSYKQFKFSHCSYLKVTKSLSIHAQANLYLLLKKLKPVLKFSTKILILTAFLYITRRKFQSIKI